MPPTAAPAPGWRGALTLLRPALASIRFLPRTFALGWQAAPGYALIQVALVMLQGLLPAASVWLTKLLVDAVAATAAWRAGATPRAVVPLTVALLAVSLLR